MNILLVTWHAGGNVPPLLGIGSELVRRGHRVRCLAPERLRSSCERLGIAFSTTEHGADFDPLASLALDESQRAQAEVFLGPGYGEDLAAAISAEAPDVALVDCFLAAALARAELLGSPHAVLAHVLPGWLVPFWDRALLRPTNAMRLGVGLAPVASFAEVLARSLRVIVTSPNWLEDGMAGVPAELTNLRYTGPVAAPPEGSFVAEGAGATVGEATTGAADRSPDGRPLVLVSFSTTAMGQEEPLRNVILALSRLPVKAIVTAGPAVDQSVLPHAPNVEVRSWVPHAEVLARAALTITHGGLGTVMSALAHGVPLLCLPLGRDQDHVAGRVEALGVGRRIGADVTPDDVAAAASALLGDPAFTRAARSAASRLRAAGDGAANAADELEALAREALAKEGGSR